MAEEDSGMEDRTEEASPHRREEWRKEGRVAQSKDLGAGILLVATAGAMFMFSQWSLKGISALFERTFASMDRFSQGDWTYNTVTEIIQFMMEAFLYIIAPIAAASFIAGVGASLVQFGFLWTTKPMEPDLDKLNPLSGIKRIFSIQGLVELLKATIRFVIAAAVLYFMLKDWAGESGKLLDQEAAGVAQFLGNKIFILMSSVGGAMFLISLFDFFYQKFTYEQKIKMTKLEVREERKQTEGNPQIKSRIRALQRKVATRKMLDAVKKADVVVTNPTHIAIALIYDRENMMAPKVVARGADFMAERIKKIARENGIPCVENVPLARALYKSFKIGQFITRDFFNAVAEVLAFVYRMRGKVT